MREIEAQRITEAVERLCIEANRLLPPDVAAALAAARQREEAPLARSALAEVLENARIAREEGTPLCQDTGLAVFFVELGQEVHVTGGALQSAMDEGVRRGYTKGCLRKSTVYDPVLRRKNPGDNTPAIVHLTLVPGDAFRITFAPKGAGSENASALAMLKPAEGLEGVKRFVLGTVEKAGPNACPPVIVGVGLGGTAELCMRLAKEALLREVGSRHPDGDMAALEEELLSEINALGIGAQGFGGSVTALAVHIKAHPAHIASLPVAVNMQCHAARHRSVTL